MPRIAATVLFALASVLGRVPWPWLQHLGNVIARLWQRIDAREARVVRINLALAMPGMGDDARARLQAQVLRTTAWQTLETLRLWSSPPDANLGLIDTQQGIELFDAALAAPQGLIIAAPHYGNWELLNQWLASRTPLAILYRPPESAIGEAFLRRARNDESGRITQVPADAGAVRQLVKRLRAGGVVGILPDQQPKAGEGEFAPFFGVPALTMTLLPKLAARTGARVLFAWCERSGFDPHTHAPRFTLHFTPAPNALASPDPTVGVCALNTAVEAVARRQPAQYQWTYKRYTLRPPGSGEENPYWRQEHA